MFAFYPIFIPVSGNPGEIGVFLFAYGISGMLVFLLVIGGARLHSNIQNWRFERDIKESNDFAVQEANLHAQLFLGKDLCDSSGNDIIRVESITFDGEYYIVNNIKRLRPGQIFLLEDYKKMNRG